MKSKVSLALAALAAALSACDNAQTARPVVARAEELGGASIVIRSAGRTYVPEIQCVYVEISWPGVFSTLGGMMFNSYPGNESGTWNFTAEKIPVGPVTVLARAYDGPYTAAGCSGNLKFEGSTTQTIVASATAMVTLYLQETTHADPFANAAPHFESLFASATNIAQGDTVDLSATATDSDTSQTLTYTWSLDGVAFGSGASTTWTAPTGTEAPGPYPLKVTVEDGAGGKAEATILITIGLSSIEAVVQMNSWPQVTGIDAAIAEDRSVSFLAHAFDADGDTLGYAWALDPLCDGSLVAAGASATFTAGTTGATCTATVTVTDGEHGGSGEGSVTFTTAAPTFTSGPQFVLRWLSPNTLYDADGAKRAEVVAIPVNNVTSDKTFTWIDGASGGTFAPYDGPFPNPDQSDMWYTPAPCAGPGTHAVPITVTMTAGGASNSATTTLTVICN